MKIEADITVYCSDCNKELSVTQDRYDKITVEPCESCMKAKYEDGKEDGYEDGYERGQEDIEEKP